MTTPYLTPPVFSWPAAPGGKLHTYLAGGTVAQATYSDAAGVTPNTNPVTLDSLGSAVVRLAVGVAYHFVLKDATDVTTLWDADNYDNAYLSSSTITAAIVGAVLYPAHAGEGAAGVTPTNLYKFYGDLTRYGAVCDSGVTDNTTALQSALSANAGYYPVLVHSVGSAYYKITGRVTAPAKTRIVMDHGAELRWNATAATGTNWLGSASRPGIEVTGDNFMLEGKGKITGPATVAAGSGAGNGGVSAYVSNEFGLMRIGTSAAVRGTGFVVRDVEISLWGSNGIATQFMQDVQIIGCTIHDIGYAGMQHLSAQNVKEYYNKVYGIAPGTGGNCYGITHSHDSTNYSADPNVTAAPRQTVNPFCIDMDCAFNEIRDVPLWSALDAHGCYEGRYHHNAIYNCHRGLQISASSGGGANYAGENNRIEDNVIYGTQINGNATTDVSGFQAGIVINGGSVLTHRGVICARNHLFGIGHANASPTVFGIEATFCSGAVIEANTFHGCVGRAIYFSTSTNIVRGNFFDSLGASATGSVCISIDSNAGACLVQGNLHKPLSGTLTAYATGLSLPGSGNSRITLNGNDFSSCTTPYTGITGTLTLGLSDITPQITDATTGSHTLDVSVVGQAPWFKIAATQAGVATLTSLLNPQFLGQECTIIMTGASVLTVNNSGNIKLQGGSRALSSSSELTLIWDGSKWQEKSCTIGNT